MHYAYDRYCQVHDLKMRGDWQVIEAMLCYTQDLA